MNCETITLQPYKAVHICTIFITLIPFTPNTLFTLELICVKSKPKPLRLLIVL